MKISLSDGNASETYASLEQAVKAATTWYDYLGKVPKKMQMKNINSVDDLNNAITRWEALLAEGEGKSNFYGHGGYMVSAATRAGYRLVAKEEEEEEEEE